MKKIQSKYTQNIKALDLMVSEKKIFFTFSYCKSTGDDDPRGVANLDPQEHDWQDLCRVPLIIATHKLQKLWASWF